MENGINTVSLIFVLFRIKWKKLPYQWKFYIDYKMSECREHHERKVFPNDCFRFRFL